MRSFGLCRFLVAALSLVAISIDSVWSQTPAGHLPPAVLGPTWQQFDETVRRLENEIRSLREERNPYHRPATDFGPISVAPRTTETIALAQYQQPLPESAEFSAGTVNANPGRFSGQFSGTLPFGIGTNLNTPPEFKGGLIIFGENVAMKIGGYVKADFIYDFDPIDSPERFITTSIPVGALPRTNTRFHARQSRLSFDTRWTSNEQIVRIFLEGDFFAEDDGYQLRHAYGEVGSLLVGQTWTTFTDVAAIPATLDVEGSVATVKRRQAQVRWTQPILCEDLTYSLAAEDTRFIIETPVGITGEPRTPSPDFVARLRLSKPWGQFQTAYLYRVGAFQPTGGDVFTRSAWGLNFTGAVPVGDSTKGYYQILFGNGIGSYRNLPDAAPESATTDELLGVFGWMGGITHDWNDRLSSNFTYAENTLDNAAFQSPDDVHRTTYLAANLIWSPLDRVKVGIEYLYGLRENVDRAAGSANRLQIAFIFGLP